MASIEVKYEDGSIQQITMFNPDIVGLSDCRIRDGGDPFIAVNIGDGSHTLIAFLPVALAAELSDKLATLFPPQPGDDIAAAIEKEDDFR